MTLFLTAMAPSLNANAIPDKARSLLRERDMLQQQLLQADQEAANAMLRGEDPLELYSRQTGLQEQVDVIQMRLESLAMRLEFEIPELSTHIEEYDPEEALDASIAVGRHRAELALQSRCTHACGNIVSDVNFSSFLDF